MTYRAISAVVAGALMLGGCSGMKILNAGSSECEFRVHTDRERCLQNNRSNDEALKARKEARRDSKSSQMTLPGGKAESAEGM